MGHSEKKKFRISLRYKLAFPVSVSVFVILLIVLHATIQLVREFVTEAYQARVLTQVETFTESIKADFLLQNFNSLGSRLEWLSSKSQIYGTQIVDSEGAVVVQVPPRRKLPLIKEPFLGVEPLFPRRSLFSVLFKLKPEVLEIRPGVFPDLFLATAPFNLRNKQLGRIQVFFTTSEVNEMIRRIYQKRLVFSFLAAFIIALLTALLTWLAIRPLFQLGKTVREILGGKIDARAKIRTGDEIEDLADAFNEMVSRLQLSLRNLKARSEALEESEEKYRILVENASDVIWLLSSERKIIFLNQPFAGLSREAMIKEGLPLFFSFHTEESIEKFEAAIEEVKKSKTPVYHLETIYHHPQTHSQIYYSTNLTPVLTRPGELKAIQGVSRDVTELKRIEMMKEKLIRDVAHELKTPVAKFQMTISWLEKEMQKEHLGRFNEVLELMKRNADLLMKIIMEIMDLSRLESGAERIQRKPCDLNQILVRLLDDLEPLVRQKQLQLERRLAAGSLSLQGDDQMLYRLFSNLIVNAMKFTAQGKIIVTSRKTNEKITVLVSDAGVGLEKDDLKRVFDRFFQKTPATEGMGVGLALVREIAVLHGGEIHAESEGMGKGSTFIVEFPL